MNQIEPEVVFSIDFGGTNIKGCLVNRHGEIISRYEVPTGIKEGMPAVENRIVELIRYLNEADRIGDYKLIGGAICCPGVVDPETNIVKSSAPNIPGLEGYPLAANIGRTLSLPIFAMNDAKAAALGEYAYGAGQGGETVCFFCLSTGVGFGAVVNGKVHRGHNNEAGEVGHSAISVDFEPDRSCGKACGRKGCIEAYISSRGFLRTWTLLRNRGITTEYNPASGEENIKDIFKYAMLKRPDVLCLKSVEESSRHLAIAMAQVISHWAPDIFVIGGQIARDGNFFLPMVQKELQKMLASQPGLLAGLQIIPGKFPADAGCLGAARNAFDMIDASRTSIFRE